MTTFHMVSLKQVRQLNNNTTATWFFATVEFVESKVMIFMTMKVMSFITESCPKLAAAQIACELPSYLYD